MIKPSSTYIIYNFLSSIMISSKQFKFMLVKLSAVQWGHWELFSSHVSMHTSQPKGCLQQLDITKGDLIKSKKTLQINISFSICVVRVELIDDRRIATSSRLLHIIPLSRLLFMSFTMVNRSSKSEWNIYLSMPPHLFMSLENLIINISLIFICNVTKILLCKSCYFEMIAI